MYRTLDRVTMEGTIYLLSACFLLLVAGIAGVSGSLPFLAVLLGATGALFAARNRIPPLGRIGRYELQRYVANGWVATALAATTTTLALGATPAEMQALGGILGLVAMLNYFLRPVYYVSYSLVSSAVDRGRPENS